MYYQLGDYTDTGCFLYIYNVSTVELYLRINGNYHMNAHFLENTPQKK
jgi:hypothetical protein